MSAGELLRSNALDPAPLFDEPSSSMTTWRPFRGSGMIIQPIVEGQGEVDAVPLLLRRLRDEAQAWGLEVAKPHRRPRTQLVKKEFLQSRGAGCWADT